MKYIWEEHDIVPGRVVWGWNRARNSKALIGYDPSVSAEEGNYALILLADGQVNIIGATKKALVDNLNRYGYRPDGIEPDMLPSTEKDS